MGDLLPSLEKARLVPGAASPLIPASWTPTLDLAISYDAKQVQNGTLLRVSEVKTAPTVHFEAEPEAASYTLMLVDPDAPTPEDPKFAFWRHWILPGLQPLKDAPGVVGETKFAATPYLGPGPKDDSAPHRYLFLLFREPKGLELRKEDVGGDEFVQRRSFDAAAFVQKHALELVAVNWMHGVGDGWKAGAS